MADTVVLVHGIWMPRLIMWLLARRLRRRGFETSLFGYPSLFSTPANNARRLADFIRNSKGRVHLVGHSLGGIVILHALQQQPEIVSGNIVLLGSPVNGSLLAQRLYRYRLTRWLVGCSVEQGLLGDVPRWHGSQPLGVIAGTKPRGIGQLLGGLPGDHDGTVTVAETVLENATATWLYRTTHLVMVFSGAVAERVSGFLRHGRFEPTV